MHLLLTLRVELVLSTKFLIWHGINLSVYSLKSPLSSADFTIYAPGIGTLSYSLISNGSVYSLKSPLSSADFTIYAPGIGTLLYSLISSGEYSAFAHFAAAIANHYN